MNMTVSVDHDVGRLQVPMQHAMIVRGAEAGTQLPGDLHRLFPRKSAGARSSDARSSPSMNSIDIKTSPSASWPMS